MSDKKRGHKAGEDMGKKNTTRRIAERLDVDQSVRTRRRAPRSGAMEPAANIETDQEASSKTSERTAYRMKPGNPSPRTSQSGYGHKSSTVGTVTRQGTSRRPA